jgi:hypothetical protein
MELGARSAERATQDNHITHQFNKFEQHTVMDIVAGALKSIGETADQVGHIRHKLDDLPICAHLALLQQLLTKTLS